MALSPKEREKIIEEETLRYETRQNLHKQYCAGRPVRWPWIVLGALLVYALWAHIFCGGQGCDYRHMGGGMSGGHKCTGMMWAPDESKGVEPGQPVEPKKK